MQPLRQHKPGLLCCSLLAAQAFPHGGMLSGAAKASSIQFPTVTFAFGSLSAFCFNQGLQVCRRSHQFLAFSRLFGSPLIVKTLPYLAVSSAFLFLGLFFPVPSTHISCVLFPSISAATHKFFLSGPFSLSLPPVLPLTSPLPRWGMFSEGPPRLLADTYHIAQR